MSRLYNILDKVASDAIVETGTSNGWAYTKYADGTMKAERDLASGTNWTARGSTGIYYNQTDWDIPAGMTFKSGYASSQTSVFCISVQIQSYQGTVSLMIFRAAQTAASISAHAVIFGTYT